MTNTKTLFTSFTITRQGIQDYASHVMLHVLDVDTRSALLSDDMEGFDLLSTLFIENRFTEHSSFTTDMLMNSAVQTYGVSGIMNIINDYNHATYQGQSVSETDVELINELALAIAYDMVNHMNNHDTMLSWGYKEYVLLEARKGTITFEQLRDSCLGLGLITGGDREDVDKLVESNDDLVVLGNFSTLMEAVAELKYQGLTVEQITRQHVGPYSTINVYDVGVDTTDFVVVVG